MKEETLTKSYFTSPMPGGWYARGTYFDGSSSSAHAVRMRISIDEKLLLDYEFGELCRVSLADCIFDPPLGSTARVIRLPGGARLETKDHEAMEIFDNLRVRGKRGVLLAMVEKNWQWTLLGVFVLAGVVAAFYLVGIPWLARGIAFQMPNEVLESMSDNTLKALDTMASMKATELPVSRQEELQSGFSMVKDSVGSETYSYQLVFRSAPNVGPNALALPSGTIVVTDEFVALAQDDTEIYSVIAHEIGHVEQRHGVRMVIQNSGAFMLLAGLLGDISTLTSVGAALPTMLAESNYSRNFEKEADQFAGEFSIRQGWGTKPLQDILLRLDKSMMDVPGESFISTHPETQARVQALQKMEE